MAVTDISGYWFCEDIPSLTITEVGGATTVEYVIRRYNGTLLGRFVEIYYPVNDTIVIRDMGSLISPYLSEIVASDSLFDNNLMSNYNLRVYVEVSLYDSHSVMFSKVNFYVIYSHVRMSSRPEAFVGVFLSNYKERRVRPTQFTPVSFLYHEQSEIAATLGVAYLKEGKAKYKTIDLPVPSSGIYVTVLYRISPGKVIDELRAIYPDDCESVSLEDLVYYTVTLSCHGVKSDSIKHILDRRTLPQETSMLFYNAFGTVETITLSGRDERASQMEATHVWMDNQYVKNTTELVFSHAHNTGYISGEDHAALIDMIHSPHVFLYEDCSIGDEVTITEFEDVTSFPKLEPASAKVTYRVANRNQRSFVRIPNADVEVFDKTFDESFE